MAAAELHIKLIHLLPSNAILQRFNSGKLVPAHHINHVNEGPISDLVTADDVGDRGHGRDNDVDTVQCNLFSVELNKAPKYIALSYTWGLPTVCKSIVINGRCSDVTINLEAALRHLRRDIIEPLVLWVDAICIDQSDEDEKSEQVMHMQEIYARADSAVTWLGTGGSQLAMEWMNHFGGRAAALGIGTTPAMLLRKVLARAEHGMAQEVSEERVFAFDLRRSLDDEQNRHYYDLITGLQDLLSRAYWTRVWIVQEVTRAAEITFGTDSGTLSYNALHQALRLLRNFRLWQALKLGHGSTRPSLIREDSGLRSRVIDTDPSHAIDLLKVSRAEGAMPLMYLLRRLQRFKASDPRDRIFALLGIATDVAKLGIKPDYAKSCEDVYTETARILLSHGYFDVLSHCIHEPHDPDAVSSKLRLPTWTPDWSRGTTCSPLQQRSLDRSQKPILQTVLQPEFKVSGVRYQPSADTIPRPQWDTPLKLSVILLGAVCRLGNGWEAQNIGNWFRSLHTLVCSSSSRLTDSCERAHAVWRTAVADQDIRRHYHKPRLSAETVNKLVATFPDKSNIDAQTLISNSFGDYLESLNSIGQGRRPFLTTAGDLGIASNEARDGDEVAIILGADVPYLLRRRVEGEGFVFIGEAYMHGCMDGQRAGSDACVVHVDIH